ncbi:hypothetical protein FHX12_005235 [Rhizobium sp. BK609]|nr:hypothetical protein [Rhizobium sp. BK098]MBB3618219.1 hypothetical protein [Rhizobium sp. BK609]MBB3683876.1 hypothetical protein [Rhizobium sp. BK612]
MSFPSLTGLSLFAVATHQSGHFRQRRAIDRRKAFGDALSVSQRPVLAHLPFAVNRLDVDFDAEDAFHLGCDEFRQRIFPRSMAQRAGAIAFSG